MDDEQLKVDSYTGMGLALQMVYDPWCDFRGPKRTFSFSFPASLQLLASYMHFFL